MPNENKKIARTATEVLMLLWVAGFMKSWRKAMQISEHLAKDDYHFSPGELGMALNRAKYLTRRGARGSYEYIQKHPFIESNEKE